LPAQLVRRDAGALQLRPFLRMTEMLGPAALAYVDSSRLADSDAAGVSAVPLDDPGVAKLWESVPPDDAAESGLDEITSPAFVTYDEGLVTAAAGWIRWPTDVAHLCVLTAPASRGRGLGRAVARPGGPRSAGGRVVSAVARPAPRVAPARAGAGLS
jgi:hypothetical protein